MGTRTVTSGGERYMWVTAWGAPVPQALGQTIAQELTLDGYTVRPLGNTIQFRQDKNNMPSADAVKEKTLIIRDRLLAEFHPDNEEDITP